MKLPIPLALVLFALAGSPASAQGLVAFPWQECPLVEGKPLCVWVVDAAPRAILRPGEIVEGNFFLDQLNPGDEPAEVARQYRNRFGVFQRQENYTLEPGVLAGGLGPGFFPETRVVGTIIVWSNKPLLQWAWVVEHHMERLPGAGRNYHDQTPQSIGQMHVPIIPVDCGAAKGSAPKTFRWVCTAVSGPPPPQ